MSDKISDFTAVPELTRFQWEGHWTAVRCCEKLTSFCLLFRFVTVSWTLIEKGVDVVQQHVALWTSTVLQIVIIIQLDFKESFLSARFMISCLSAECWEVSAVVVCNKTWTTNAHCAPCLFFLFESPFPPCSSINESVHMFKIRLCWIRNSGGANLHQLL